MSKTRTPRRTSAAFTLLELLLVLILVGISMAAAVPNLTGTLGAWQLRESARNLQAALQLASHWASVRQESVAFVLDTRRSIFSVRLMRAEGATGPALPAVDRQALGQGVVVSQVEGLDDVKQEKLLTFGPGGTSRAATIVLTQGGSGSASRIIWQIDLDGRGTVRYREVVANGKSE